MLFSYFLNGPVHCGNEEKANFSEKMLLSVHTSVMVNTSAECFHVNADVF